MARAETTKIYNTFLKGLITEAGELTFPENATLDELNCDLSIKGSRKRRLGMDFEDDYQESSNSFNASTLEDNVVSTNIWKNVGGNGSTEFLVVQISDTLYFHDLSGASISGEEKSFTVNLNTFLSAGNTNPGTEEIQTASGKGVLFVSNKKINPFYIEYDSATDTISTTEITVQIRDFEGLNDGLAIDEEPVSLSSAHRYNLYNQGWNRPPGVSTELYTTYFSTASKYPSNNQIWWIGKNSSDNFDASLLRKTDFGNTPAPKGHFILDAFNKDYSTVSGIAGLTTVSVTNRPATLEFFAGRVFYGGVESSGLSGTVFFSQVLQSGDLSGVGQCYQAADPASEYDSELVATDGGSVVIPKAGNIQRLFAIDKYLIVIADNGVWAIAGSDSGFTATDYQVIEVSNISTKDYGTIVNVEGFPIWWSEEGIVTLVVSPEGALDVQSLSETTIQSYFENDITSIAKSNAVGAYDRVSKKVIWLYKENDIGANPRKYDRALLFDLRLKAFHLYKIATSDNFPYAASLFETQSITRITSNEVVTDGGETVVDGLEDVTDTVDLLTSSSTSLKYLCIIPSGNSLTYSFSLFRSTSFYDWVTFDNTGLNYSSFIETGYELIGDIMRDKRFSYILCYLTQTETAWEETINGDYVLNNPSSCLMQVKWEWTDTVDSNRWSSSEQVYRLQQHLVPNINDLDYDDGYKLVVTKNKVRGKGRAFSIRFSSEEGKDFDLKGWAILLTGVTKP